MQTGCPCAEPAINVDRPMSGEQGYLTKVDLLAYGGATSVSHTLTREHGNRSAAVHCALPFPGDPLDCYTLSITDNAISFCASSTASRFTSAARIDSYADLPSASRKGGRGLSIVAIIASTVFIASANSK